MEVEDKGRDAALAAKAKQRSIREAAKKAKEVSNVSLKEELRSLDRRTPNNMYQRVEKVRLSRKEMQSEEHLVSFLHPDLLENDRITMNRFNRKTFQRGLHETEEPFPVSPQIGPYNIEKPLFGSKNYYWCSCGMSKNQPFCDSSHRGTLFRPLKFNLEEKVKSMQLCGCKLSKQAPFCDGVTCM